MKNIFALLFLLFILVNTNAQTNQTCSKESFEVAITTGTGGYTHQPKITEHAGTPLVYFSYEDDTDSANNQDVVLTKYDLNGEITWSNEYDQLTSQFNHDILVNSDGNIYTLNSGSGSDNTHLRKIDANGNQVWHKGSPQSEFNAMTSNNNEGVTLSGDDFTTGTNTREIFLSNFDENGNALWAKKIILATQINNISSSSIIHIPTGGYMITTRTDNKPTILKISETGEVLFSKVYNFPGRWIVSTETINESQTGFYSLYSRNPAPGSIVYGIREMDFDGNLIRAADLEGNSTLYLKDMSVTPEGNFIIQAHLNSPNDMASILIKLDTDWNVEEAKNFTSTDEESSGVAGAKGHIVIDNHIYRTWTREYLVRLQKIPLSLSSDCPNIPIEVSTSSFSFGEENKSFEVIDIPIEVNDYPPETYDYIHDYSIICAGSTSSNSGDLLVELQDSYCQSGTVFLNYSICNLGEETLPAGLPVSTFGQDPTLIASNPTQTFNLPLEIGPDSCYEGSFQVEGYDEFYLVINADGNQDMPFDLENFSSDFVSECDFTNNIASVSNIEDVAFFIGTQDLFFCEGETFEFNGVNYTESATVSQLLPSSQGCDSISISQIQMLTVSFTEETLEYQEGETAIIFGESYAENAVVQNTFSAANGCDSIHQVNLIFLEVPPVECASNSFQMRFSKPGELIYGTRIIESDNGPLTAFYQPFTGQGDINSLAQFDNQGQVIWSKDYNYEDDVRVNELLKASDGGILINSDVAGENILQKTDAEGNWQWSKKYKYSSIYTRFSTVLSEDNGNIMMAGQTQEGGILGNRGILLSTNSSGDVIWEKRYAADIEDSEAIFISDMIQIPTGEYIVSGVTNYVQPMIASFSSSGDFLWGKYFDLPLPFAQQSLVLNEDQTSFYFLYESSPEANIGIAEYDFAGNQLFAREYSVTGDLTPGHLTVLDDGSLIIDGDFQFSFFEEKSPFFLRLDANKEVINAVKHLVFGNQATVENSAKTNTVIGGTIYSVYEGVVSGMMYAFPLSLESECSTEEVEVSYTDVNFLETDFTVQEIEGQLNVEDVTPQVSDITLVQFFACEASTNNDLFTSETLQFCAGETAEVLGNQYTSNTIIEEDLTSVNGCDSTHQIELVFLEETFSSETITACEGETMTIFGNEYTSAGVFQETFESYLGCDSTHQITLIFNQPTFQNEAFQACEGDVVTVFGVPVTESGDYSDIFVGSNGCDSTLTISLTFLENAFTTETIELCEGETINIFGDNYTESTTIQGNFNTSTSCDSTHTVTLIFLENAQSFETIEACEGDVLTILGQAISENTTLNQILPAANGCDSTHFTNIVFTETINTFESLTGCADESVIVFGNEIFNDTIVEESFTSYSGCDSIHQVTLSFLEEINTFEIIEICEGETAVVFGNEYTSSGVFEETFNSHLGCDSIHQITLIVNQPTFEYEIFQACEGDIVTMFGTPTSENGNYSGVFTGSNGCDSTLTISLVFFDHIYSSEIIEICEGETAIIFGNEYNENTVVEQTFTTPLGCDSTHTVTLVIIENTQTFETIEACAGESLIISGQTIFENTTVEQISIAANSCDSIHTINVLFTDIINTAEVLAACAGEGLNIFGNEIFSDTILTETFISTFGCDSIHQITVSFLDAFNTFETIEACEGEVISILNNDYSENTTVEQNLLAGNGCDSTHQISLIFKETFYTEEFIEICEDESVSVFGNEINTSQVLSETFTAENGCDSIHQVSLNVFENIFSFETQEYCAGETATIFGNSISENDVLVESFTSQNGCDSLHEITVIFNEEINIFLNDTICAGDSIMFSDDLIFSSGNYEFISLGIDEDCDTTTYLNLEVLPEIEYSLIADTLIPKGMVFQIPLQTELDNLSIEWSPMTGLSCTDCQNPTVVVEENITYEVLLTNELGCSSSAQIKIGMEPIPAFFIPQAFSPNGDEANDYFTVFGNEKIEIIEEMQIFDRWGALIFSQQDFPPNKLEAGWDGTYRGQKLNTGVFVYSIRLKQVDGRVIKEAGDILLTY